MGKGEGEFKDSVLLNGSCGREAEDFWQNVESPVAVAESENSEGENLHEVTCSVTELEGEIADAVMENSKTPEESHRLKNLVELVEDEDWNQVKARPGVSDSAGKCCANSSTMCHQHAHVPSSAHLFESSACGGSSGGLLGAPGWAVGRASARLSSSWCCPGCGLYGDGSLCMTCGTYGVGNSCTGNSKPNLRVVRSREPREGTKTLRVRSGIQVGSPILDNASGNAGLADYLRWAPRSWPIEAWECWVLLSPYVEKTRFFLARGCEVLSTIMQTHEWSSVSTGPGEPLRSWLGWTPLLRTPSSGVWLFRGAVRGEQLLAALVSTVDWVTRGTYRTAWAVEPRCLCSYAYGRRVAVGPQTGARSWELLRDLWKAIAPQLAP